MAATTQAVLPLRIGKRARPAASSLRSPSWPSGKEFCVPTLNALFPTRKSRQERRSAHKWGRAIRCGSSDGAS